MFRLKGNFGNFYFKNGLVYTKDRKVVRLVTISANWHFSKSQLWKHFSSFGTVEDLQWEKDKRVGSVLFQEASQAAKVLVLTKHHLYGHVLYLQPSTSRREPPVKESETISAYDIPVVDDFWYKVLEYLPLNARLNFAASCKRFKTIYELESRRNNRVLNMKDVCTLDDFGIKILMRLSGKHIHCVKGGPLHWTLMLEFVQLLGVSCPNLAELSFYKISVSLDHMTHLFDGANGLNNITTISLRCCDLADPQIYCLQMLSKLKSLDIAQNHFIRGESLNSLPISLEILNVSKCDRLRPKNLINLASLTHLRELRCSGISKLTKNELFKRFAHYCPMLEVLEVTDIMKKIQLGGLSRLHTLVIQSSEGSGDHMNNLMLSSIAESYSLRRLEIIDSFERFFTISFDLSILSPLKELRTLILHNLNFTPEHLMGLQKLPALEFLDLSGSPDLSNEDVAKLTKPLGRLRRLTVERCPFISRQLTEILKGNPKLQVVF